MQEIKVSPKELKQIIENGKLLGAGFFGTVFTYKDHLIKLDERLYNLIKVNDPIFSDSVVKDFYRFETDDFQDRKQIEALARKQKDITLTKLPEGIVTLKDVPDRIEGVSPGIIIPYHKNHQQLELLDPKEYKKVLIILKKLLLEVKELADNRIAQNDLVHYGKTDKKKRGYNVMYKDNNPQIIDLSGDFVKVGDEFTNSDEMYNSLSNVFLDYFYLNDLPLPVDREEVKTYKDNEDLLKELEGKLK